MSNRKVKSQGKGTDVNGEGAEKDDGTSVTKADAASFSLQDDNPKIAGAANGYKQATR